MQTHGGYDCIKDYDFERYWREVRLFKIAPVSQEMVLTQNRRARARAAAFVLNVDDAGRSC